VLAKLEYFFMPFYYCHFLFYLQFLADEQLVLFGLTRVQIAQTLAETLYSAVVLPPLNQQVTSLYRLSCFSLRPNLQFFLREVVLENFNFCQVFNLKHKFICNQMLLCKIKPANGPLKIAVEEVFRALLCLL
jgi:hypothetical protein